MFTLFQVEEVDTVTGVVILVVVDFTMTTDVDATTDITITIEMIVTCHLIEADPVHPITNDRIANHVIENIKIK